jgi:hypothetical protein
MSFTLQLSPDIIPLETGSATPVAVIVVNKGPEADRYELELEGLDSEWKAVPVPVFGVEAGETHTEKFFLKPPRSPESISGNYPFVVRVRSLVTGEQRTVQGMAQVKPFHYLSMEISPRKGSFSPVRHRNNFEVTVMNLGNVEHTLQLVASDPEDACTYEFGAEQIVLGPGQQRMVEMVAHPTSSRLISGSRLIGFTVTGRSTEPPTGVATTQGQLEQRPLLSLATLALILIFATIVGLWWVSRPKPPAIALSVDPPQVMVGDTVTVTWSAEHARRVVIRAGESVVYEGPDANGSRTVTATTEGTMTIYGEVTSGKLRGDATVRLQVSPTPVVPAPEIQAVTVDRNRIRLGEAFVLRYRLSPSVTSAILQPMGLQLDPALDEREIVPTREGKLEYSLVARNSAGVSVEKSVTVTVVDESDARILAFGASAREVPAEDAHITLNWQAAGAERVEIQVGREAPFNVPITGSQDFDLQEKTVFTLIAIDRRGRRVSKSLTVNVLPPVQVDPGLPGSTSGDPGSGTGMTSGSTGTPETTGSPLTTTGTR